MSSSITASASAPVSTSVEPQSSISRSSTPAASSSSFNPFSTPGVSGGGGGGGGGTSGSLYIYTFLITIIVLASISGALLFRAYYIRRRFQRRVEDAIRNGQPLPQDAAAALGLLRPRQKKEKKLGPMPGMWEAEMLLDEKHDEEASVGMGGRGWEKGEGSSRWAGLTPVSVVHFPPAITPNPLEDDDAIYDLPPDLFAPAPQRFQFLPNWLPQPRLPRPPHLARTTSAPLTRREPAYLIPERGAPVSLGVVIAMPFEGNRDHYWTREEDEEREVPQVVLGVVDARIE